MVTGVPRDWKISNAIGPTMLFVIRADSFQKNRILRLLTALRNSEPYEVPISTHEETERFAEKFITMHRNVGWGVVDWIWDRAYDLGGSGPASYVPADRESRSTLQLDNQTIVRGTEHDWLPTLDEFFLYFGRQGSRWLGRFPPDGDNDPKKIEFVVGKLKEAANIFEPRFSLIDDMGINVKKRRGEDLRKYAWGVTIYGPELVAKIGREKLLKTPAYKVEELPWGGVWVQVAENPFTALPNDKKAVEKYLDLKNVFA